MSGYWQAPEATAKVISDGWLDSGDLAHADQDGYLWFFGRKKQVIVHDGSNVSPLEVEGALVEHPAIDLAGVVGVHDEVHGENVRAYVTLREGAERPAVADLIRFCRERIGYKAPEEIVFLDEMPLNPTGKIDRVGLKRMAEDHLNLRPSPDWRPGRVELARPDRRVLHGSSPGASERRVQDGEQDDRDAGRGEQVPRPRPEKRQE